MDRGYVHVYTGDGKGKTTAAFGLAVRAACYGKKVYIGQFVKDMKYNETKVEACLPNIKIEQLGVGCFIDRAPTSVDKEAAQTALRSCAQLLKSGAYDLIILDEINIAIHFKLVAVEEVIEAIDGRADGVDVLLTGRHAPDELIARADLVTEMKEVKHYYSQGILSRPGIDC
ncbi:MAG TPA: cob(I)yrinic acid a,c-diamide adenosyltransferase [Firmicutes bacterium]|jgi:cob(I)alamin adenosyltransferase|nr:cob(I)yrinic acid a,c-diamide adenosyltransferase [Bacillota bacterium]